MLPRHVAIIRTSLAAFVAFTVAIESKAISPTEVELPFFVWFTSGVHEIVQDEAPIAVAAMCLRSFSKARARVTGYTDRSGPSDFNLVLSERRANHVRNRLLTLGISDARLGHAEGNGEDQSLPNEAPNPMGRRVELVIVGPATDLPRICPASEPLCSPRHGPCLSEY